MTNIKFYHLQRRIFRDFNVETTISCYDYCDYFFFFFFRTFIFSDVGQIGFAVNFLFLWTNDANQIRSVQISTAVLDFPIWRHRFRNSMSHFYIGGYGDEEKASYSQL